MARDAQLHILTARGRAGPNLRQTTELRVLGTRDCYDDFMAGLCVLDSYFCTLSFKDVARLGHPRG
jgi:hypothetical protein